MCGWKRVVVEIECRCGGGSGRVRERGGKQNLFTLQYYLNGGVALGVTSAKRAVERRRHLSTLCQD